MNFPKDSNTSILISYDPAEQKVCRNTSRILSKTSFFFGQLDKPISRLGRCYPELGKFIYPMLKNLISTLIARVECFGISFKKVNGNIFMNFIREISVD